MNSFSPVRSLREGLKVELLLCNIAFGSLHGYALSSNGKDMVDFHDLKLTHDLNA
jgi:hypothetical protein